MKCTAVRPGKFKSPGFSLLELVTVLVIGSVLFVMFAPKAFNRDPITVHVQAKTFAANLQRAQLLATSRGISVSVCTASTGYSFRLGVTCGGALIADPAGGEFSVELKNGATLGGGSLGVPWFFNSAGTPSAGAAYEMKSSAGPTFTIAVAPLTGLITVN